VHPCLNLLGFSCNSDLMLERKRTEEREVGVCSERHYIYCQDQEERKK